MGNASFSFLAFALAVVLIFNLNRSVVWRQGVLFAASLIFIATFSNNYQAFLPLVAFIVFGYAGSLLVGRGFPLFSVVTAVLAMFVWLKRYTFVPPALFLGFPYLTVGLSYILFRVLSVIVDRHTERPEPELTFFRYLMYTTNFTTFVSGPIQRYSDFASMAFARVRPPLTFPDGAAAFERIALGYFKTNVGALVFSLLQSRALAKVTGFGESKLLPGAILFVSYTFFLYCNFSGYIDIVIGISRLLRIVLPENFNRPFAAENFIDFWSRWHITLSEWLKTYVYTPLLMTLMRRFPSPRLELVWGLLAFFFTFLLIGVWHGQTPSFLFFGFLQGLGVSGNKLYQVLLTRRLGRKGYRSLASNGFYIAASRGLTFTWFTFTLIWFWSTEEQLHQIYSSLGAREFSAIWTLILVASTAGLVFWETVHKTAALPGWIPRRYWRTARITLLVAITLAVAFLSGMSAPDIVYKAF